MSASAHDEWVWVQPGDGPAWMNGGTYLVARRIEMNLEEWDEETLEDQEQTSAGRRAPARRSAVVLSRRLRTSRPAASTASR
jgi:deferrochelatase/peroxidase EfeB